MTLSSTSMLAVKLIEYDYAACKLILKGFKEAQKLCTKVCSLTMIEPYSLALKSDSSYPFYNTGMDEDGDVADEILEEVLLETSPSNEAHQKPKPLPKFQVKYSTRPATKDRKLQQCMEHRGRLEWV